MAEKMYAAGFEALRAVKRGEVIEVDGMKIRQVESDQRDRTSEFKVGALALIAEREGPLLTQIEEVFEGKPNIHGVTKKTILTTDMPDDRAKINELGYPSVQAAIVEFVEAEEATPEEPFLAEPAA